MATIRVDDLGQGELAALWALTQGVHPQARTTIENVLIAAALKKGTPRSGNWGHTSHTRTGQIGGSDPGGGVARLGLFPEASAAQRRAASAQLGPKERGRTADERRVASELEDAKRYLATLSPGSADHQAFSDYVEQAQTG